ncbi:MAG: hypothetical protein ACTHOR_05070 [Devosia sp.]
MDDAAGLMDFVVGIGLFFYLLKARLSGLAAQEGGTNLSKMIFAIAALPVLLASSAVLAAGAKPTAATSTTPGFVLTGTGGVQAFNLPSFDTGYFGHSANSTILGGMIGANLTGVVGEQGDRDVLLGLSIFGAWGSGTTTFNDTFSGQGTVAFSGMSLPGNNGTPSTIALSVTPPTASSHVTDNNPQGGGSASNVDSAGGTQNIGTVQAAATGNSFALANVANSGSTTGSAAYGAIADTSGGIFIGTGDLSNLSITTSVTRSVGYGGGDATIGLNTHVNDTTQLLVYGGPSVRVLSESDTTKVTANMAALQPSVVTFPNFAVTNTDQLNSMYWGGVIGTSVAFQASPGIQVNLGGEAGLYDVHSSWSGQSSYSTCCGNFDASSPVSGASPALNVSSPSMTQDLGNAFGYALRGNGGVSFDMGGNKTLTLGANAEYLSRVAQVNHGTLSASSNTGGAATFDSSAPAMSVPGPTFSWGSMISYGASVSLSGHFD